MKSTIEILNEIAKPYSCNTFLKFLLEYAVDGEHTDTTMVREIRNAMIAYAQQAIEEDRKIVAENARAYTDSEGEWVSSEVTAKVSKSSILNAPKLELK